MTGAVRAVDNWPSSLASAAMLPGMGKACPKVFFGENYSYGLVELLEVFLAPDGAVRTGEIVWQGLERRTRRITLEFVTRVLVEQVTAFGTAKPGHGQEMTGSDILARPYFRKMAERASGSMLTRSRSPCMCGRESSRRSMTRNQSQGT